MVKLYPKADLFSSYGTIRQVVGFLLRASISRRGFRYEGCTFSHVRLLRRAKKSAHDNGHFLRIRKRLSIVFEVPIFNVRLISLVTWTPETC